MQTFPGQFYVNKKMFALESQILLFDHDDICITMLKICNSVLTEPLKYNF